MSWFEEQLRQREQGDWDAFRSSCASMAQSVQGKRRRDPIYRRQHRNDFASAVTDILGYYHLKAGSFPAHLEEQEDQLEYMLRPHGIMYRRVTLEKGWYNEAIWPLLATRKEDGKPVALLPNKVSGYWFRDENGCACKLDRHTQELFEENAYSFYQPFPLRKLRIRDLLIYMKNMISGGDVLIFLLASLAVTLVGMISPYIDNVLISTVLPSGDPSLLVSLASFALCAAVSLMIFTTFKSLYLERLDSKMGPAVQAAGMMRVLSLPVDFFKKYSAGELSRRLQLMSELCTVLVESVFALTVSALFSLLYLRQIFIYAPCLVWPTALIIFCTLVLSIVTARMQSQLLRKRLALSTKESGMNYALISGVSKIRLAGAEKRAFARWGELYARTAALEYDIPLFLKINVALNNLILLGGTIFLYYVAARNQVAVADYYAFNTAYAFVSGAFYSLGTVALSIGQVRPAMEILKPLLEQMPEISTEKEMVSHLSGGIELDNITFRYNAEMAPVLENLSLKIRPGQYIAIVGKTGCGKSTLLRLLLGFEMPQRGAIYYDGRDIRHLDLKSLRRNIGTVLQGGSLFQGNVYSNITISAPWLSEAEAWEAAEMVGMAEDIRNMPMGMHTLISEGSGGISGGQAQRLMIARAIAARPKILMFDEATSALDNITQKVVTESLDQLKCTRIIIAHRLSTIRQCDRIIVLDQGHIVEDGSYEQLIAQNGEFARLVARQRLDTE